MLVPDMDLDEVDRAILNSLLSMVEISSTKDMRKITKLILVEAV